MIKKSKSKIFPGAEKRFQSPVANGPWRVPEWMNACMNKKPLPVLHIIIKVKSTNGKEAVLKMSGKDKTNPTKETSHTSQKQGAIYKNTIKTKWDSLSRVGEAHSCWT